MKKISLLIVSILLLSCTVSYADALGKGFSRAADRTDKYGTAGYPTGLKELTKEEKIEIQRTHKVIKQIRLNDIGLSRINAARKKKGQKALKAQSVKQGEDIIAELPSATVSKSALESIFENTAMPGDLPNSVDNSTLKYFPPIVNQVGPSCSMNAAYYAMGYTWARVNNIDAKDGGDSCRFSTKFNNNMLNGGADVGTWYFWAYDIGKEFGCMTWEEFPQDSNFKEWCPNPDAWKNALSHRVDSYARIAAEGNQTQIDEIKQLLNNGNVLNFSTRITSWVYKNAADDPSTPLDDSYVGKKVVVMEDDKDGAHAMTFVGYNDNIWVDINNNGTVDSGEKGAFRIANSWGTGWGENGYVWMAYDVALDTSAVSDWDTSTRVSGVGIYYVYSLQFKLDVQPRYVAEFTLNHAKRNQLKVSLGISSTSSTSPTSTWNPDRMLQEAGGAYAFDGTETPCDMTFYMDCTELVGSDPVDKRIYLIVEDNTAGDSGLLKSFSLTDLTDSTKSEYQALPTSVDNKTIQPYVSAVGSQFYMLTVNNGGGDGNYVEGEVVSITAETAPTGQIFEKWVASFDNPSIYNIYALSTTLTMPSSAATITATYKAIEYVSLIPFTETFEARTPSSLNGQHSWVASGVEVQTNVTYGGSANAGAISVNGGYLRQTFSEAHTRVWTDMRLQIVYAEEQPAPPPESTTVGIFVSTNSQVMVFDGTNVVSSGLSCTEGEWVRFTIFNDYNTATWVLYVNGNQAGPFRFFDSTATSYSELSLGGGQTFVDDLFITENAVYTLYASGGTITPLDWVQSYGGDPTLVNQDGDGLTLDQEYLIETDPTTSNTFAITAMGFTPDNAPYLQYNANGAPNGKLSVSNSTDIAKGSWTEMEGALSLPTSNIVQWTGSHPAGTNNIMRIYVTE